MNIFYLDQNPKLCAQYHSDKHVVKMILESAQLLCTALNVVAGEQVTPYKSTHVNHPCSIWVRKSFANWNYVYQLMLCLEDEWRFRFNHDKKHKSVKLLEEFSSNRSFRSLAREYLFTDKLMTPPPLCMPDDCKSKLESDLWTFGGKEVLSYRKYYNQEKRHLHKWTNREAPFWITN